MRHGYRFHSESILTNKGGSFLHYNVEILRVYGFLLSARHINIERFCRGF